MQLDTSINAQRERLLAHLKTIGELSTHYARTILDTPHPAGRIRELRRAGHNITTSKQPVNTGRGFHMMVVYRLIGGSNV
jgi:hypothetical protein